MKQLINFLFAGLFAFLVVACSPGNQVSTASNPEEVAKALTDDNWIFIANNSNPQVGRSRGALIGVNEVKYTKDSLIVYLPYSGRLYSGAEAFNSRGPLDFTSTEMEVAKEKKGDSWEVTIKPKDHSPVQSMYFTLFENGSAQLNVTLTNRSPISFTGSVKRASSN